MAINIYYELEDSIENLGEILKKYVVETDVERFREYPWYNYVLLKNSKRIWCEDNGQIRYMFNMTAIELSMEEFICIKLAATPLWK